jgi:nucleoside-diphosphate-sugar epimerase
MPSSKQKSVAAAAASAMLPGFSSIPPKCLVTGGSGFVGQRLVEMLVERGATKVVSFDISPKPKDAMESLKIQYVQGDLTKPADVFSAAEEVDCVFHIAALVGPYHHKDAYVKVNVEGTQNILDACKHWGITKLVMSSSPSTRFPYPDPNIDGLTEDDLVAVNGGDFAPVFLQPYAETKAQGEKLVRDACGTGDKDTDLLTVAVAPHQVYGPRDGLFLPNLLSAAGTGSLRVFGSGENRISFCHVDNYCHGLILGAEALYPHSPALGKFYIITDGPPIKFWHVLDEAAIAMGFTSLFSKFHLPVWLMMCVAYLTVFLGDCFAMLTGTPKHVVNYHLKLNPFAVKMLVIHR